MTPLPLPPPPPGVLAESIAGARLAIEEGGLAESAPPAPSVPRPVQPPPVADPSLRSPEAATIGPNGRLSVYRPGQGWMLQFCPFIAGRQSFEERQAWCGIHCPLLVVGFGSATVCCGSVPVRYATVAAEGGP